MAGPLYELAWSPASWRKVSMTPTLPLLSSPRMAVLFPVCLGN